MIYIIHGDSTDESRNYYYEFKKSYPNLSTISGLNINNDELEHLFQGGNLFFEDKNIAVENLLSKNKAGKPLDETIDILNTHSKDANIILWEEKEIGKKSLDKFPKAQIQFFKIPKLIFNFLDSILPGNGKNLVVLFHKLLENNAVEIIIYMMTRQLRLLIAIKDKGESIDEILKMAPWQKGRIEKQAGLFKKEALISLYSKLYKIDSSQKTGKLSMPVESAIDIFLLDI